MTSDVSRVGPLTFAKVVNGLVNAALLTLVPLLGRVERLLHPVPWVLFVASAVLLVTQPRLRLKEMLRTVAEGRSGIGIMASAVLVNVAPVIEFGYRDELAPPVLSGWFLGGLVVLSLGAGLRLAAIAALGQFFTAVVAVQPGQTVVDQGPFRLIRHPSYAGTILCAIGGALLARSIVGGVLTVVAMVPAYLYRIAREEVWLAEKLGAPYREYQSRSKRLVPFVY